MYQIDYKKLNEIVENICENDLKIVNNINTYIESLNI